MRRTVFVVLLELMSAIAAAGADAAGCSVRKGLYDQWLASASRGSGGAHTLLKGALASGSSPYAAGTTKQEAIVQDYRSFFQCLSAAAEQPDPAVLQASCKDAASDKVAALVCETALYLKGGRTASKEFVDTLPGKKGAEAVWELDAIAARADQAAAPAISPPKGPAYKLLDELFLLVLDGTEGAASKYFAIASIASGEAAHHTDDQIKVLLREAPAVVVQEWPILRQYQPRLKKLVSELAASLSAAELTQMRRGLAGFCSKDNLDCPEILKVLGRE